MGDSKKYVIASLIVPVDFWHKKNMTIPLYNIGTMMNDENVYTFNRYILYK